MRKYKKNQKMEVVWIDIVSDSAWVPDDKAEGYMPALCKDLGYFLNSDKDVLRISSSYQPTGKERNITVFPLGCIKKINTLK